MILVYRFSPFVFRLYSLHHALLLYNLPFLTVFSTFSHVLPYSTLYLLSFFSLLNATILLLQEDC